MKTEDIDQQIITHLSSGMSTKAIATKLHLSKIAIEKRIDQLRQQCGAKNRVELITMAFRNAVPGIYLR